MRSESSGAATRRVQFDIFGGIDPPWIASLLAPGGVLVYETFTTTQRALGWGPSRDAFLLEPGELRGLFPDLVVERFEEGPTEGPEPAETARLLARRPR